MYLNTLYNILRDLPAYYIILILCTLKKPLCYVKIKKAYIILVTLHFRFSEESSEISSIDETSEESSVDLDKTVHPRSLGGLCKDKDNIQNIFIRAF